MKKLIYLLIGAAIIGGVYYVASRPNQTIINVGGDQAQAGKDLGATLVWVEGGVEYKHSSDEWKRASIDVSLSEGDMVETLSDGRAIINLDDGSAIRLDNKSSIALISLKPDHVVILNGQGQVYARVVKSSRQFDVKAGDATYQSLGTAYKTINTDENQGVEVYQSQVKIISNEQQEITVAEGNKYFIKAKDKTLEKVMNKISKEDVQKDKFAMWNKVEDEKSAEFKSQLGVLDPNYKPSESEAATSTSGDDTAAETETAAAQSGIVLSAVKVDSGVKFTWQVKGLEITSGFKLVKGSASNPAYPGNTYQYLTNNEQRSYTWGIADGQTYYFRICQYQDGKCMAYSNNIKITTPVKEEASDETSQGAVTAITLAAGTSGKVTWKANGTSASGYKVVWSKTSNPTYPTRDGDKYLYYSSPEAAAATLDAFDGSGKYYVRVCEYLGGKCGVYSNQVTVEFAGDAAAESPVTSISLSGSGRAVSWTTNGYSASGFKIVWSQSAGPTYPTRDGDQYIYLSDPSAKSASLEAFDGAGQYHVRVCEYLGGKCGVYSNEIVVNLE